MSRRKRLLLISQYFPLAQGGAEYQTYCLAKYFQTQMDIHYLTNSDDRPQWQDGPLTIWGIPERKRLRRVLGRCYALDYFRLRDVLRRIGPDVIYVRGASAYLAIAARYARSSACTLVWHLSSSRDVQRFRFRSLRAVPFDYVDKKMIEYGLRHAHYILGQAKYQDDLLRRNYGRRCDRIVGNWHPAPAQPCTKGPSVKVVWVANLKPLKRPDLFVDLAERLGGIARAEFIMIGRPGPGRYQRRLESRLRQTQGLAFLGERSIGEVNAVLAEAHVFVNTSEWEGFPNTFVQAWLREVPVVSLQVDPDDVLQREGIGFRSGSFDRLVQDTKNLIENADLRRQMGRRAQAYARKNHSLAANLPKVAEFLQG
jgi:glycosyltransferase involved in cell wall biosynthesis